MDSAEALLEAGVLPSFTCHGRDDCATLDNLKPPITSLKGACMALALGQWHSA